MKFILTGDFHIRLDQPISRIDNFLETQKQILKFIVDQTIKNKAMCLCTGDIFHKAKSKNNEESIILLADIFKPINIYSVAGNHDLINHSLSYFDKSSIGVISRLDNWFFQKEKIFNDDLVRFFNFGEKIKNCNIKDKIKIAVIHKYVGEKDNPFFMKNKGIEAQKLLDKYDYDYFITGDNHQSFIYEKDNRFVINCGCITRQRLNEKDYRLSIYLLDTDKQKIETIYLPDNLDVVQNTYQVVTQEDRENNIDSFIELCEKENNNIFDFESSLLDYCYKNNVLDEVENEIKNVLFEAKN